MGTPRRFWLLLALLPLMSPVLADQPPLLRYTTYMLIETGPAPVEVRLKSSGYASLHGDFVYKDQPQYVVLDDHGSPVDSSEGKLNEQATVTIPASTAPFALLQLIPGNNYVSAELKAPHGLVATEHAPLNCVRGFERHYFWVPRGLQAASIFLHAFSPKEAARVVVYDPTGTIVKEFEDDFQEPLAVTFDIPEGQDAMAWSVAVVKPKNPEWSIDDCKVWLGGSLPGVLARTAEWAERLSRPFAVEWRPALGFEDPKDLRSWQWNVPLAEAAQPGATVAVSPEKPHRGAQSLRLQVGLPDGYGERNMLKVFTRMFEAGSVRRVKFWMWGDGSGRTLQVRLRDQSEEAFYGPTVPINWRGWGEVTVDFGGTGVTIAGGDGNKKIDGPQIGLVFQISHTPGQALQAVCYLDDVAVAP